MWFCCFCQLALELVEHLRAMGETNALFQRNPVLKRDTALATAAIYQSMFGLEDGSIPATFQVLYFSCWNKTKQTLPYLNFMVQQHPFFLSKAELIWDRNN